MNKEQFLNRVVKVIKTKNPTTIGGRNYVFDNFEKDQTDSVWNELETAFTNLRIWFPNTMGTCDYQLSRINVVITEQQDGTFIISKVYNG